MRGYSYMRRVGLLTLMSGILLAAAHARAQAQEKTKPIGTRHKLPGLVAGIARGGELIAAGAAGVRKLGDRTPITIHDKVHIGSCTKAMTATLLGILVDDGKLKWSTTIGETLPEVKRNLHPAYAGAALDKLLAHQAGLPANVDWWGLGRNRSTQQQRLALLQSGLRSQPEAAPGEFHYSNTGYVVAAAMAEKVTGQSWEKLMTDRLFKPLGISSAGFGSPSKAGRVDQPWGHMRSPQGKLEPIQHDNAPVMGPAGTVHLTLADWAKFAGLHSRGEMGQAKLIKPETLKFLHTPAPGHDYAGGWNVAERDWAGGETLSHAGSNTMWLAVIWIAPKRDLAFMAVTNHPLDAGARKACDEAIEKLIAYNEGLKK
jgi:CubicO group peptidase (beta-lactamase class C family)